MDRLVLNVFKILGISIIMMILLDTSLMVYDTVSVHNKVTSLASVVQNEVARNNSVPSALAPTFEGLFQEIEQKSKVATSITTNIVNDMQISQGGTTQTLKGLNDGNLANYGDILTLGISVNMSPSRIYFARSDVASITKETGGILDYKLNYVYKIPALRYLK